MPDVEMEPGMESTLDVKVCGVCRAEDARQAGIAGATYVGVILAPGRTRTQTIGEAARILDATDAVRVGVFVDAAAEDVIAAVRDLSLGAVQLHGDESIALVRRIRDAVSSEVWKAIRVRHPEDVVRGTDAYAGNIDALLLDGWCADAHGGAGVQFDWSAVAAAGMPSGLRLVLAGGLTPANVAAAVSLLRPSVVDVSSGVEYAPGRKSPEMINAFIAAARGMEVSR